MSHAILLISCPDQKGITATVTQFIYQNNGNIVHADQHIDEFTHFPSQHFSGHKTKQANHQSTFFMRIEWSLENFSIEKDQIKNSFQTIAEKFSMTWSLHFTDDLPKAAVFVSKPLHCLYDLLWRYKSGQLRCKIPLIISNHSTAKGLAKEFGINYFEFPITKGSKHQQEERQIALLNEAQTDLVVLARYHQILSGRFVQAYHNKIINIHHSFLPAFVGKKPYAQAYERGVKIIGATSHFVTEELDAGPIIEQDTVRVSHRDDLQDLIRKGEDLERIVLSRAVRLFLERKVLSYGNKTVIFD